MIISRKKLVLAAAACLVMAPVTIISGLGNASPAGLTAAFAGLPLSVWMGLIVMAALVICAWLSIDDESGDTRP